MRKKYLVCPGHVVSKSDGDVHYISPRDLMQLYGVYPAECVIYTGELQADYTKLIKLKPRYDGDYSIKAAEAGE